MTELCDVCGFRPATARVTLVRNGRQQVLRVCATDLARLQDQSHYISPFDALFAGEGYFGNFDSTLEEQAAQTFNQESTVDYSQHFSQLSKQVFQRSAEITGMHGQSVLDTEHLLAALTEQPIIQDILREVKVQANELHDDLMNVLPQNQEVVEQVGVSPRIKRVVELSFAASRDLRHSYIGPEHLLIALSEEGEGSAAEHLRKLGLTPENLRQKIVRVVGAGAKDGIISRKTSTPNLDKYSRDLTELARQNKLDPVIGRAEQIETTIEVLARRTKNNPALVGEPGVGKTAIVEGLAQRIIRNEVPEPLQNKRVVELSINSMVAGSRFRGDFEERVKAVLDEITAHQDELVIFIDEIHTIVGAGQGGGEGGLDISNVMKPALARGELHLIGATTLGEYQKYIEKDPALERRFQPVTVPEPSVEDSIAILRGLRDRYEAYHRVRITDAALVAAASLADRYITNRFLPDKAIDLIDQAASRVRIALTSRSSEMHELDEKIQTLKREQELASNHREYDRAKGLQAELAEITEQYEIAAGLWKTQKGVSNAEVSSEHIAQIVSKLTRVPVTELTQEEKDRLLNLEERLHGRVIGQDDAVQSVADAVRRSRAGLSEKGKPTATFLFLGPTGVGKTELAKAVATTVFGDESAIIRLDMSEYGERHSVARMVGSPPGYVGHEEGGQLSEAVRRRPYSVILLDEIEKAHPEVYNMLLQVLDEGRLTDGKGRVVNFTNTVIIATSNVGSDFLKQERIGFTTSEDETRNESLREKSLAAVRKHFRPEFINRLDEIIMFHPLAADHLAQIVEIQLESLRTRMAQQGIKVQVSDALKEYLAQIGYSAEYGARELRRIIQSTVENPLAKAVLTGSIPKGTEISLTIDDGKLCIDQPVMA